MRIVITGADGFIGSNLRLRLRELRGVESRASRATPAQPSWRSRSRAADFVFHLAGVNRPQNEAEFVAGNADFTDTLCAALRAAGRSDARRVSHRRRRRDATIPTAAASARRSRRCCDYAARHRRAGRMSSGCRTCSANGAGRTTIRRSRPSATTSRAACRSRSTIPRRRCSWCMSTTWSTRSWRCLRAPAQSVRLLESRPGLRRPRSASWRDSCRAFATAAIAVTPERSALASRARCMPPTSATCRRKRSPTTCRSHGDPRGVFVEMLKTPDCGQFSYFTAHPASPAASTIITARPRSSW